MIYMYSLLRLKLHLQKNKTDFIANNKEVLEYLKDKNITIENFGFGEYNRQNFGSSTAKFDENILQEISEKISTDHNLATKLTIEEKELILNKIREFTHIPAGKIGGETELYFEQQISDILGFIVTSQDEYLMPYNFGTMKAEPHLKTSPFDNLESHDFCLSAGLETNRSIFGYFGKKELEKYYISLPLNLVQGFEKDYQNIVSWFKHKKVVVINPNEQLAIVAVVGNTLSALPIQYQFGGSPELIIRGKIWSEKNKGKVMVFYVDDPSDKIPLGVIKL